MGKNKKRPAQSGVSTSAHKKSKSTAATNSNNTNDWLDSLVQKSVVESNTNNIILSKEDRKRKREVRKAKRQQQKEQQQHKGGTPAKKQALLEDIKKSDPSQSGISKDRLQRISTALENVRRKLYGDGASQIKLYNAALAAKTIAATKKRKLNRKWSEDSIQPRPSDYSGIGLARQSLFIEFVDPSYFPKLEEEFREHIPGFFGKQRTKAMKRQTDGNMLWRQLQDKKSSMSKKLKNMNPDERVQAMIDSGMI